MNHLESQHPSRTFEESAWASYDMAFRCQAANCGSLDGRIVDAALYNEAFVGQVKQILPCRHALIPGVPKRTNQPRLVWDAALEHLEAIWSHRPLAVKQDMPSLQLSGRLEMQIPLLPLRSLVCQVQTPSSSSRVYQWPSTANTEPLVAGGGSHGYPPLTAS